MWLNAAKPKVGALGGATSAQKWSLLPHGDQSNVPTTVLPTKAAVKERGGSGGRKGRRPSAGLARKRSDDDVSKDNGKEGDSEDDDGGGEKGSSSRRRRKPSKGPPAKRGDGFDPSWSEDPNNPHGDGGGGDGDENMSAYDDDEDDKAEEVQMSGFEKLKKNRLQPGGAGAGGRSGGGKGGGRGGRGGRGVKPSIGKAKRWTSRGGGGESDNDDDNGSGGGRLRMESTGSIDSFNDESMGLGDGFGSGRQMDAPADPLEDQWDLEDAPAYDGPVEEPPPLIDDKLCPVCGDKLIRKTRRHCRACGRGCCYPCSDQTMRLPQFGLPRLQPVCELCHEALADEQTAMAAAAAAASAREPGRGGTIAEVKKRQEEEAAATALDAQTESGAASAAMAEAVAQHRDAAQAHAELAAAAEAEAAAAKKQEIHSPAVTAARRLADQKAEKLKTFLEAEKVALAAAAAKGGGSASREVDSGGPALLDGDASVSGGASLVCIFHKYIILGILRAFECHYFFFIFH